MGFDAMGAQQGPGGVIAVSLHDGREGENQEWNRCQARKPLVTVTHLHGRDHASCARQSRDEASCIVAR